jgi:hypothetical protein
MERLFIGVRWLLRRAELFIIYVVYFKVLFAGVRCDQQDDEGIAP